LGPGPARLPAARHRGGRRGAPRCEFEESFVDLGRLDRILAAIRRGDLLLISFGHNDEADDPARHTAGASPNYPAGVSDNTHFQAHGAIEVARLVAAAGRMLPGRDSRALRDPALPDDLLSWPATRPAESRRNLNRR
jgi:hypothetical protein